MVIPSYFSYKSKFPSPLEDFGGSNKGENQFGSLQSMFPSPLEDFGGSNLIHGYCRFKNGYISVPSRGLWGF